MILDALFGEPGWLWRRLPHPAVLMGRAVDWFEARLNNGPARRLKGAVTVFGLVAMTAIPAALLSHPVFHGILEVAGAAILLAQRSLSDHVRAVSAALARSLEQGRREVALIVGRDPETLDEAGVARAAVESAAENWSDGVFAPAFWFIIAGLPGIAVYKMVNTADSMIGHRNARYGEFGWAAARLDDALNWVPARLAGLLICMVGGRRKAMRAMLRDAGKHKSPNAGWPEAAVAASLGIRLAGPRIYGGIATDDPYLNAEGRDPAVPDINDAVALIWMAWGALLVLALLGAILRLL